MSHSIRILDVKISQMSMCTSIVFNETCSLGGDGQIFSFIFHSYFHESSMNTPMTPPFLMLIHVVGDIISRSAMSSPHLYIYIYIIYIYIYYIYIIYIYIYISIYIYIWVNYNDLTATSLESWLIREIIPKWL